MNITLRGNELTNCLATTTALEDGMLVWSVKGFPSMQFDIKGVLDHFHPFLPAGFYYKMLMWSDWHLFERAIRKMAGLRHLDRRETDACQSEQVQDACDLLVIGAGPAGLIAAKAAANADQSVMLVGDHPDAGGSAY